MTRIRGGAKCDTLGGRQEILFINESGLYSLILRSQLPAAKRFKRWVTSEVLPAIRRHGMYATEELIAIPTLPSQPSRH
ncbi:MAG: Bro-N domain-containing protein [Blautia sp.]|uniref:BRO-N domain-containing protein n=1 Tax=Blautia sp. TaxID=1955243 RepID=UPI0039937BE8